METDPARVSELAREKTDENWRFRSFMKMLPRRRQQQINRAAEELGLKAQAQMDCRTCGACCRENWIPIDDQEALRLASRLSLPVLEFKQAYLVTDPDQETGIDARPCPFLAGTECRVYSDRPEVCRGYPYIGGDIASRMVGIIERAEVCPIVFEMLEQLKRHLRFA